MGCGPSWPANFELPEADFELDRPFAELGLNSVMAMSVRRATEQFVGFELSVTMLWNHPTVASLAASLAEKSYRRKTRMTTSMCCPTRTAVCWMTCSTVWNRLRPVVRAVSDEY